MTKEQLNALINLGFTGEQILAINDAGKTKGTTPTPTPTPINPAPDANPTPKETETVKMLKEILGLNRAGNLNGIGPNPPAE
ncbi:MAG: hypothetical protein J6Q89_02820, partial [Clostridia bacterium]|nr:hypothetical protein [Clostridia bacterium]